MRASRFLFVVVALYTAASWAAHVNMKDPKRALGRRDDIRIDAQLSDDTIASSAPIRVVYQIQNLTPQFIAIADRVCDATYDSDSRTIVVTIGAEIPADTTMPHLVTIAPGEKRVFKAGANPRVVTPSTRGPFTAIPRFVQIKVNVLRDTTAFAPLIAQQSRTQVAPPLSNELFDKWLDVNDAIDLNAIPVQWTPQARSAVPMADQRGPGF